MKIKYSKQQQEVFFLIMVLILLFCCALAVAFLHKSTTENEVHKVNSASSHFYNLSETYSYLSSIRGNNLEQLKIELTNKLESQLSVLLQTTNDGLLEKKCIPYRYLKYRRKLEEEDLNMKVTELLQQKVKPDSSCKK